MKILSIVIRNAFRHRLRRFRATLRLPCDSSLSPHPARLSVDVWHTRCTYNADDTSGDS